MRKAVFAILVMMMAAVGAVATVSCGSDSDAEAAIAVDKKVKQRWHCKGFGLPSHIKEMVIDLTREGKMKVYVKYVDALQGVLGLDDVWYEGHEYTYSMTVAFEDRGENAYLTLDDNTVVQLRDVGRRSMTWYHYDYLQRGWKESPFEPMDTPLSARQLPFHGSATTLVGQWMIAESSKNEFLKFQPAYGDYAVLTELPFYINGSGQFQYDGSSRFLGMQKAENGTMTLSVLGTDDPDIRIVINDPTHAQMLQATSDGFTLWHELVKETSPINVGR